MSRVRGWLEAEGDWLNLALSSVIDVMVQALDYHIISIHLSGKLIYFCFVSVVRVGCGCVGCLFDELSGGMPVRSFHVLHSYHLLSFHFSTIVRLRALQTRLHLLCFCYFLLALHAPA